MQKNTTDPNNDIEIQQKSPSVSGYVDFIHVASPVSNNISVQISEDGKITLKDGRLTNGIGASPGDKLLMVLQLALIHKIRVNITMHIHEGTNYIDHIALIREKR
ncbi:hypothetical protein [Xenorhabdus lircayensis]|uniref:Uncharacterized protein n=1 Tax=Xenorhabdus lircayensis TaxID=2763499 RepID=A0ABS0UAZ2_9GAMM|nr:hypothetical protein [Xenorhabdus lircayensis]MBI6549855.1 hypothetical protein [Xenorhabdus lircayensis]